VLPDSTGAHVEPLCHPGVCESLGDEAQDLQFALGEMGLVVLRPGRLRLSIGEGVLYGLVWRPSDHAASHAFSSSRERAAVR
jgi:hypothetical protein